MEKKINLEELFNQYSETDCDYCYTKESIFQFAIQFGKELLYLASGNADLEDNPHYFNEDNMIHKWDIYIDKKSITDTIKQVE